MKALWILQGISSFIVASKSIHFLLVLFIITILIKSVFKTSDLCLHLWIKSYLSFFFSSVSWSLSVFLFILSVSCFCLCHFTNTKLTTGVAYNQRCFPFGNVRENDPWSVRHLVFGTQAPDTRPYCLNTKVKFTRRAYLYYYYCRLYGKQWIHYSPSWPLIISKPRPVSLSSAYLLVEMKKAEHLL